jgi:hypothetical protein
MPPNFTGEWRLMRGESDFGFLPPPKLRIDTIAHDGARFHLQTLQRDANGKVIVDRDLEIGGPPVEIAIRGRGRSIRAFWEGDVLVIETTSEVSGKARRLEDRWTLEPGGERLTIARLHEQPGGPVRQRLCMQRDGA